MASFFSNQKKKPHFIDLFLKFFIEFHLSLDREQLGEVSTAKLVGNPFMGWLWQLVPLFYIVMVRPVTFSIRLLMV